MFSATRGAAGVATNTNYTAMTGDDLQRLMESEELEEKALRGIASALSREQCINLCLRRNRMPAQRLCDPTSPMGRLWSRLHIFQQMTHTSKPVPIRRTYTPRLNDFAYIASGNIENGVSARGFSDMSQFVSVSSVDGRPSGQQESGGGGGGGGAVSNTSISISSGSKGKKKTSHGSRSRWAGRGRRRVGRSRASTGTAHSDALAHDALFFTIDMGFIATMEACFAEITTPAFQRGVEMLLGVKPSRKMTLLDCLFSSFTPQFIAFAAASKTMNSLSSGSRVATVRLSSVFLPKQRIIQERALANGMADWIRGGMKLDDA